MYVFAGGGTGGHLFPGIAVARAILDQRIAAEVLFIGSERDVERRILADAGLPHLSLAAFSTADLRRNPAMFAWGSWRAYRRAVAILNERRPQAVIGCGGFASVPVVLAAARLAVPVLLLEQNIIPGRATRRLSRWAAAVCVSFAQTVEEFPRSVRCVVTGNPVRREIVDAFQDPPAGEIDEGPPTLLILGGSQGAASINAAVIALAAQAPRLFEGWRILHQTGSDDAASLAEAYHRLGIDARVESFFTDMAAIYRQTDAALSRAGATTLAEFAIAAIPSILVPFPKAARDHQRLNATTFQDAGAAFLVQQGRNGQETAQRLKPSLVSLLQDAALRQRMRQACRRLARYDAAQAVVHEIQEIVTRI